jgi:SNF2 family DNA or RNA helicase
MLRLLQRCLERSLPKHERVLCIDGDIAREERDVVLDKFRQLHASGYNILLMTIHCGNVGIDLSMADHVLLPTPAYNTTLEQQAIDRLHRFPQSKPVHVVRYIAGRTSVDGYVRQIQQRKLRNVVQVAVPDVRSTGFEDLSADKEDLPTDFAVVREFFRAHLPQLGA